jgi:carbamoyltransferase
MTRATRPPDRRRVLGVSFDFHDAAAAVVVGGELVAAVQEERFSRVKHDPSLPVRSIEWCLEHAGLGPDDLDEVVFYEKPLGVYERVLTSHAARGPRSIAGLTRAATAWTRSKLWVGHRLERELRRLGYRPPPISYCEHHLSHAAAAFFPSPFAEAAILTVDGVGEWATATIAVGRGDRIEVLEQMRFPHSIGLLYTAITVHCGFAANDGEYKLMGLAPYGSPRYVDAMRSALVEQMDDGSVRLSNEHLDLTGHGPLLTSSADAALGGPARSPGAPLTAREADLAASMQAVLNESVVSMAEHARELTGVAALCMAGGVALNCVANGHVLRSGHFEDLWVQPAAGDAGSAVGAAYWGYHVLGGAPRADPGGSDAMGAGFLGPGFRFEEIRQWLDVAGVPHHVPASRSLLEELVVDHLEAGDVVGWFTGRAEFGPRALGHRSILADPRDPGAAARINARIKQRESFRPFAPAILEEHASEWFESGRPSPYMLVVDHLVTSRRGPERPVADALDLGARLRAVGSQVPACTHVDHSARVQTVNRDENPHLHSLLTCFMDRTGCPVLLNTSMNGPDEPIALTPADALRCFERLGLDVLVLEDAVITRSSIRGIAGPAEETAS